MTAGDSLLAVVIPAYKARHLRETLASFAAQTDRRFSVYIGDDASPDPIEPIAREFSGSMPVQYTRFADNLGGHCMVGQWSRCLALTRGEPWLWVFGDDDRVPEDAVSAFYRTLASGPPVDLLRFQLELIDDSGVVLPRPKPHPDFETDAAFLRAILTDRKRQWRAPDHVFSRRVYQSHGGLVDLPKGMYADYATWLKFSTVSGVRTVAGPRVAWRRHGNGTTAQVLQVKDHGRITLLAAYLGWLVGWAAGQRAELRHLVARFGPTWMAGEMALFSPPPTSAERREALRALCQIFGQSPIRIRRLIWVSELKAEMRQSSFFQTLRHWRFRLHH